jgi:hypothetical protein
MLKEVVGFLSLVDFLLITEQSSQEPNPLYTFGNIPQLLATRNES